jgi:phosphinothricin acetyltransferase
VTESQALAPRIRDAVVADLAAITRIYGHHVEHGLASFELLPPDVAEMTRRYHAVREQGMPYVVAELDGRVAGYAYTGAYRPRPAYRFTVEDTVYAAADAVGRGVGRALLETIISRCTAAGKRQMVAVIGDSGNAASIGLHRAMGFEMAGTLHSIGFKHGRWVDGVLMQRALGAGDTSPPED